MKYGLFIFVFLIVFLIGNVSAATYYMRSDGTAANKGAASGPCATQANTMSIATHDGETFSAGDVIKLCDDGGVFRDQMDIPSSGSDGSPITYEAESGDTPIISGSEIISGVWSTSKISVSSDNFDDNDITDWTVRGTVAASNQRMETTTDGGTDDAQISFTSNTELYVTFKLYLVSGYTGWDNTETAFGNGVQEAAGSDHGTFMGIRDNSGSKYWFVEWGTDAGSSSDVSMTTKTVADNTWYTITIYIKAASGVGANDGITRWWVDGGAYSNELIKELTNVDSDTASWDEARLGNWWASTLDATLYIDDFEVYDGGMANVYETTPSITTEPLIVIYDGTKLTPKDGFFGGLYSNQWDWDSDILYVNVGEDPDTGTLEAGQRGFGIWASSKSYITIDGLTLIGTNAKLIQFNTVVEGVTVKNCNMSYNGAEGGIMYNTRSGGSNVIDSNTIHDIALSCIGIKDYGGSGSGSGTESYIRNNLVYNCGNSGIFVRGNYQIIENNIIHDTGNTEAEMHALHIYSGSPGEGSGDNNIMRYNWIYNSITAPAVGKGGNAFEIDLWCDYNEISYNIAFNNDGSGLANYGASYTKVFNNVFYENLQSDSMNTYAEVKFIGTAADPSTNWEFKNNIAQATRADIYAIYVDEFTYDQSPTITNNDYYTTATNWYFWNNAGGNNLATWNALTGVGTDINSDPLLTIPGSGDFTLQPGSPAIDSGVDVGLTQDFDGNPIVSAPDIGAFEYQGFSQLPYNGPHSIPGRVEAEDYDIGGEGLAYHDTTLGNLGGQYRGEDVDIKPSNDSDSGYAVGWLDAGEWLEYTVDVSSSGEYDFRFRVLSQEDTGRFRVEVDGMDVTGDVTVPHTGQWDSESWANVYINDVYLSEGSHMMRLVSEQEWFDINYLEVNVSLPQHPADVDPQDGCIGIKELLDYISLWKKDSTANPINLLMKAIDMWTHEVGCSGP
jgi:hypothetical protein